MPQTEYDTECPRCESSETAHIGGSVSGDHVRKCRECLEVWRQ